MEEISKFCAVALHGFLGSPLHWRNIEKKLNQKGIDTDWLVPDLFDVGPLSSDFSWEKWCENLVEIIRQHFGTKKVSILGYSLGGRLALNALFYNHNLFNNVVLLSTNPGFLKSREERKVWEKKWEKIFLEESSPRKIIEMWNEQDIFLNESPVAKDIFLEELKVSFNANSRRLWAQAFSQWSLTQHLFSLEDLTKMSQPHWIWGFGEKDTKYMEIKKQMERIGIPGDYLTFPNSGHRILMTDESQIVNFLSLNRL
ncbi:MAG: alpha/beta fold hydrolase [Bdellovibrionales bacterium]|nr:alpha/beta fold hydrolase [Bdellovibrionales bacterium]